MKLKIKKIIDASWEGKSLILNKVKSIPARKYPAILSDIKDATKRNCNQPLLIINKEKTAPIKNFNFLLFAASINKSRFSQKKTSEVLFI